MKDPLASEFEPPSPRSPSGAASVADEVRAHPELLADPAALGQRILAELARRAAAGDPGSWQDYAARYPQCAEQLARAANSFASPSPPPLPSYDTVIPQALSDEPRYDTVVPGPAAAPTAEAAGDGGERFATQASAAASVGAAAERILNLGRPEIAGYDILGELGRGGMGIVYKARQRSAQRIVALKVVRSDVLDALPFDTRASTLDRFRAEAQAAANLDHDNLVTVYEVGESEGTCYYAMRYVEGRSLYDALKQGPLDQRHAARYLEPVARALHMAHERGILHRDLKPHNILVDQRTNRPLLADFGLAKFMQRSNEITHAGELLGTPSYMSPEQACDAAHVTAAADVYSLGATLYHLVTARPPFQAASLTETLRQIASQEPVAPRQLNPAIDRDLETICVKCLQKEPTRRYESAAALADDLQRYLEGRPIVARPVSMLARTWRWCRRNPLSATWIAIAATFALVSVIAILVGYVRTAAALAESRRHLAQTVGAVNELFTRFGEDDLRDEPGMQPLRVELLKRAQEHLKTLLAESSDAPWLRDYVAEARFLVGVAAMENQATRAQALTELQAARELQESLLAEPELLPAKRASRTQALAATWNALGSLQLTEARQLAALVPGGATDTKAWTRIEALSDDASRDFSRARELRETLVAASNAPVELQRLLASVVMNQGICEVNRATFAAQQELPELAQSRRAAALAHFQAAQRLRETARQALPAGDRDAVLPLEQDLGKGDFEIARLALAGPVDEARSLEHLTRAIAHFEQVAKLAPQSLANRHRLGVCLGLAGALHAQQGEGDAAWKLWERARQLLQPLAQGNPTVSAYQTEWAQLCTRRAQWLADRGDDAGAVREGTEACRTWNELLEYTSANQPARQTDIRLENARAHLALGTAARRNGQGPLALESLQRAETLFAGDAPQADTPLPWPDVTRLSLELGGALRAAKQEDAARTAWELGIERATRWLAADPQDVDAQLVHARLLVALADLPPIPSSASNVATQLSSAAATLEQALQDLPDDQEVRETLAAVYSALAACQERRGDSPAAQRAQVRAEQLRSSP
ncbi:MAG: serine/threonine-protein kinase [Pirellulales bacterium]